MLIAALLAGGCSPVFRRSAGPTGGGLAQGNRSDPALSGNGRWLATVVERGGRDTLLLQEQPSGRMVPLPSLQRLQPHRSPSLSWNGRYVAVLVQQGGRGLAVIADRATGRLQRLPLPGDLAPERLSLSPDGRRIALELIRSGRSQVQVFDLGGELEPDLPGSLPQEGGGPGEPPSR